MNSASPAQMLSPARSIAATHSPATRPTTAHPSYMRLSQVDADHRLNRRNGEEDSGWCSPEEDGVSTGYESVGSVGIRDLRMVDRYCLLETEDGSRLVEPATSRDHAEIHQLLLAVFQGPSRREFGSQNEHPLYEPSDRLVIRERGRLVAHIHPQYRRIVFADQSLMVGNLDALCTLPEYRGRGYAHQLMLGAEEQLQAAGAAMAMVCTDQPAFFREMGYAPCGRHCFSSASPRDILAQLELVRPKYRRWEQPPPSLNIRLWRQTELGSLMRIYNDNTAEGFGATQRDEDHWRWLINRQAFDQIYVAIDGPDRLDLEHRNSPIVGYAVVRRGQIVELMTSPLHDQSAAQLVRRVCADAIERDQLRVTAHAPPGHPIHQLIEDAGGRHFAAETVGSRTWMAKVFDPLEFLRRQRHNVAARVKATKRNLPIEFGMLLDGQPLTVSVTRRTVKVSSGGNLSDRLELDSPTLTQMLLGHASPSELSDRGQLAYVTDETLEIAEAVFPKLPFWQPVFDTIRGS
ncbi:MAG: GNAT family N-acetyltransferase [Pirellulaceae bacterium]|nr:GNAT family N-acetyltransferase [Planctomycetales bacterium]